MNSENTNGESRRYIVNANEPIDEHVTGDPVFFSS